MKSRWLVNGSLLLGATLIALLTGEGIFRLVRPVAPGVDPIPLERPCATCPHLYELNPERSGISEQKTRDRLYAIPKPRGTRRILLLGDSVAFGASIDRAAIFPERLERSLDRPSQRIEVVNAAVNGYGAYNEVQYFIATGRSFQPDLVLIAFCMNDVVDPLLHWNRGGRLAIRVPPDAIPNPEYHERNALPRFRYRRWKAQAAQRSALFERFARTLLPHIERRLEWEPAAAVSNERSEDGTWPTHLTLEDDLSIEVLMDYESPEWRWLRRQYDELQAAVTEAGARLAVLVFPLAYQQDPDYPHLPQSLWRRYCESRGLSCLDLLAGLRRGRGDAGFPREDDWYDDVWMDTWHLTPKGHAIAAAETASFLEREGLLSGWR